MTKPHHTASARQVLHQSDVAEDLMRKYVKRLMDLDVEVNGDEIIMRSDEQVELAARVFRELCREYGLLESKKDETDVQ